jgi:hypothetical protein
VSSFNLPTETVEFLKSGKQLSYGSKAVEWGEVKLKSLDKLELKEVTVGTETDEDPHAYEEGYYSVPAVSLTGECQSYDAEFVLLWLPNEQLFGAWDCDHWVLTVFQSTSWADIVEDPASFLNAQWDLNTTVGSRFEPWTKYEFKEGFPP